MQPVAARPRARRFQSLSIACGPSAMGRGCLIKPPATRAGATWPALRTCPTNPRRVSKNQNPIYLAYASG